MKSFKEFGIKSELHNFTGDKIKMSRILNREIVVYDYKIEDSKYKDKCLYMQIELEERRHVVFTGSKTLIDMISRVPNGEFPFKTIIKEENERYEFT